MNIVVSMMKRRIIYSLISQWPLNVEEPTRSILFEPLAFEPVTIHQYAYWLPLCAYRYLVDVAEFPIGDTPLFLND